MKKPSFRLAVFLLVILYAASMPQASFSADAAITKAEWAKLMQDADFKAADKKLGEAYKQAMAALSEAGKKTLRTEQRAWVAKREKDAFAKFGKETPGYARFLIDEAYARIAKLQSYSTQVVSGADTSTVEIQDEFWCNMARTPWPCQLGDYSGTSSDKAWDRIMGVCDIGDICRVKAKVSEDTIVEVISVQKTGRSPRFQ